MQDIKKALPLEDYEKFFNLSQAIFFDFNFKKPVDADRMKTFALAFLTAKRAYLDYCLPLMEEQGITEEDVKARQEELMKKSLV